MTKNYLIDDKANHKDFCALIDKAIENGVMPGCNIGIVSMNDKGEFKKNFFSFGNKALIPNVVKNSNETIYDMASCSKVLSTTTAIMLLLEQGKLKLYDAVKTFIPEFNGPDICIWDLMTHTAGLPEGILGSHKMNRDEIINAVLNISPKYPKNEGIHYSDVGYIILGMIVEHISKMPLDEFAKKYIFEPLDMIDTCYNPKDASRCAPTEQREGYIDLGYVHDETSHNMGGVAGHAGVFSTCFDISNFIEMVLNKGMYKDKKFLDEKTIDLLFKPQVKEQVGISLDYEMRALGWIVKNRNCCSGDLVSDETIMHTGFTGTNIFIDRINKVGFVMLANRVHPTRANTLIIPFRSRVANFVMAHLEEFR